MLERLTSDEQRAMLELLIYMAKADGKVADIEQEILENYATLVEVEFSELRADVSPEEVIPRLPSMVSRAIVLQELLRLSHLDGLFTERERVAILDIAKLMGVPVSMVHKLDEWVLEGLRWVWSGEDLLDEVEETLG
jgi:tellurite resistance protein